MSLSAQGRLLSISHHVTLDFFSNREVFCVYRRCIHAPTLGDYKTVGKQTRRNYHKGVTIHHLRRDEGKLFAFNPWKKLDLFGSLFRRRSPCTGIDDYAESKNNLSLWSGGGLKWLSTLGGLESPIPAARLKDFKEINWRFKLSL